MVVDYCSRATRLLRIASGHASTLVYGSSKSLIKGAGLEYIDFREYTWDDDIRYVDWRLSARNVGFDGDYKFFVKEFQTERKIKAMFVVDLSGSIGFGDKFDTLMYSSFLLLHLAHKLEDTVALAIMHGSRYRLHIDVEPMKAIRILKNEVCIKQPCGVSSLSDIVGVLKKIPRLRSLILFTDYGHDPMVYSSLAKCVKARDMNLLAFIITTPYELKPPINSSYIPLYDLEVGTYTVTSVDAYVKAVTEHVRNTRAILKANRVNYVELHGIAHALKSKVRIMRSYIMARVKCFPSIV